jgi:hypothetical protein
MEESQWRCVVRKVLLLSVMQKYSSSFDFAFWGKRDFKSRGELSGKYGGMIAKEG